MGDRALRLEAATSEDMAQMRTIAADAMRAGAIGFSTSRTIGHKTLAGDPIPTLRAAERDLTEIALRMAAAGHGVLERSEQGRVGKGWVHTCALRVDP